ncbi:L,D-transpeptidase [Verrucomicrobiota bacterium sgz303538]
MRISRILIVVLALNLAWIPESRAAGYRHSGSGSKRVVIDKSSQVLRAYEGNRLVFQSRVSTGKPGKRTPSGTFRARGKQRMHYSRRYHNAPMPYSVHLGGHYFIHGFSSVPKYPASRGCVRMQVGAAREFFGWISPGTPVSIRGNH